MPGLSFRQERLLSLKSHAIKTISSIPLALDLYTLGWQLLTFNWMQKDVTRWQRQITFFLKTSVVGWFTSLIASHHYRVLLIAGRDGRTDFQRD